jgi:hypothetical protein
LKRKLGSTDDRLPLSSEQSGIELVVELLLKGVLHVVGNHGRFLFTVDGRLVGARCNGRQLAGPGLGVLSSTAV